MSKSSKKGPYVDENLLAKINAMEQKREKKAIKTWARNSSISPEMVGWTFLVHNGKKFISVYVTEQMVGHKLGEFSPTRTFKSHRAPTERSMSLT